MSTLLNSATGEPPRLRVFLNMDNLTDLRADSRGPRGEGKAVFERLAADGFEGVQLTTGLPPPAGCFLPFCGMNRINVPAEADAIAQQHAARGDVCLTVHAGWGLEDDDAVFALVESILTASHRHGLPIFFETHRATITQDLWRTVQITRKFPEVRFNVDFSHYYTGQELVYGDWETKLAFMEPIFARTGFMHGRIGSPGCIQVPIGGDDGSGRPLQAHGPVDYLAHFKELWTRAMQGFIKAAGAGDYLIFAPELLSGTHYYARLFPDATGRLVEESDRYAEALLYEKIARSCFAGALHGGRSAEAAM